MKEVRAKLVVVGESPRVVEDAALACGNGVGDDGLSLSDCNDPDFGLADTRELSIGSCRDGRDNDRNGLPGRGLPHAWLLQRIRRRAYAGCHQSCA